VRASRAAPGTLPQLRASIVRSAQAIIDREDFAMFSRRHLLKTTTIATGFAASASLWPSLAHAAAAAQEAMLSRPIPATGEAMPVIGMGTSGTFEVAPDDEAALAPLAEVLRLLVEAGGRMVDTAPSYGRAEAVTGELVARGKLRDKVFLATKVSVEGRAAGQAQLDQAFAQLKTERIDLVQVHNLIDYRTQLKLLREMKERGVIRYIGVTHYVDSAHAELIDVIEREPMDFIQINLSVVSRKAEKKLLPLCRDKGVAVIINRAFEDGKLFGEVRGKPLPAWAAEIDCSSWAQLFLKYVVSHPAVTAVIPATSSAKNMADNLRAGFGRQPDAAQRQRIAALWS
jgi:diketogulonate reductase-like aldo/keto reductase